MSTPTTTTHAILTDVQADALLDFLTHAQTFHEFSALKIPGRVSSSGPPFAPSPRLPAHAPLPVLNTLFRKLALTLPGFKDVDRALWSVHVQGVLEDMAAHELSDSFDKGTISKRKTVGYGIVVVAECAARGVFAGCPTAAGREGEWDAGKVEDVREAWASVVEGFVYGRDMEELVELAAKTDKLEDLPSRYQAAHRFAAITFASFLHYLLAINPAGPTLRHLLQRVHSMLPYTLIRQALRVGNAAGMINAVVKLFLYRAPTLRGFFGSGGERSANLLQRIMSSVFTADKAALTQRLATLSASPNAGTPAQHAALAAYVHATSRADKQAMRDTACARPCSLVGLILAKDNIEPPPDETTHESLQERLFLLLSIRDREALAEVLCQRPRGATPSSSPKVAAKSSPKAAAASLGADEAPDDPNADDHLTAGVRLALSAFEPILRAVQRGADLPRAAGDAQAFLDALLALPSGAGVRAHVKLVDTHQGNLHNFLHLCAREPEVKALYMEWYGKCLGAYRAERPRPRGGAGGMRGALESLVGGLNQSERNQVLTELDGYAQHLQHLHAHSDARMRALFTPSDSDDSDEEAASEVGQDAAGPGLWLASWQGMVDRTAVTPASLHGAVRYGADGAVQAASAGDPGASSASLAAPGRSAGERVGLGANARPGMGKTEGLLRAGFEKVLVEGYMR